MGAAQAQPQATSLLPQVLTEGGYTPTPPAYWTVLPKKVSAMAQYVCIGLILQNTFGAKRKRGTPPPDWSAPLTTKFFAGYAGITDRAAELVLDDAVDRGLIARKRGDDRRGYVYQPLVENWASAPRYSPKSAPKKPAASEPEESEGAASAEDVREDVPRAALKVVPKNEAIVLLPGAQSRPIALAEAISNVMFRNDSGGELRIIPLADSDRMYFSVRAKFPGSIQDDGAAAERASNGQYPNSSSGIGSSPETVITRTGVRVNSPLIKRFQSDPRYEQIAAKLEPWFDEAYGKSLDVAMLCQILERLGEASAEKYLQICSAEWDKRTRKRRERPTSGIFLNWADDAKAAEVQRRVRTDKERRQLEQEERKVRIRALAMCLREKQQPIVSEIGDDWRAYVEQRIREADAGELLDARNLLETGEEF